METVSYTVAQRLKQKGFPQPEPVKGQIWHGNPIQPVKIGGPTGQSGEFWIAASSSNWPATADVLKSSFAFAPGREELLREINALAPASGRPAVTATDSPDELAEIWLEMKEQGRQRC